MDWKKIITTVLSIIAEQVGGPWPAALLWVLDKLTKAGYLADDAPETIRFSVTGEGVGAAPDGFKNAVRDFLLNLVGKIEGHLILVRVLRSAIDLLTDKVLDEAWDRLFGAPKAMVAGGGGEIRAAFEATLTPA